VIDSLAATGGAERRLVEEVLSLGDRFEHRVVRLYERDDLDPELTDAAIPVTGLGARAGSASRSWPLLARTLHEELRRREPAVVHTSLVQANLVGQLAARRLGLPVVSTLNRTGDVGLQEQLQPGADRLRAKVLRGIAARAARGPNVRHRAVSEHAADSWSRSMGLDRSTVTVIPRALALGPERREQARRGRGRARFELPEGGPLVVSVGRLTPEKGHHLLVAALAEVRRTRPDVQLAIAGATGPNEPRVRAAVAEAGLEGAVTLLGFRDDVPELLATADVFAFSSLSEGAPNAVLEAMAMGVPVVAFDIPPVAELTGDGRAGRLVASGSVTALAGGLAECLGPAPDRDARVAAGLDVAAAHDPAEIADRLADLLEQAAAGRATG
jgi:glycosyltransferase involved in cell wall biosynthesis